MRCASITPFERAAGQECFCSILTTVQGSLKDTFCPFETWLLPPKYRETTIYKAMFRWIMQGSLFDAVQWTSIKHAYFKNSIPIGRSREHVVQGVDLAMLSVLGGNRKDKEHFVGPSSLPDTEIWFIHSAQQLYAYALDCRT